MELWSSLGWREKVQSRQEAQKIVEKAIEYDRQNITLSWVDEEGQQVDEVLYNGLDEKKAAEWLEIHKKTRALE